MSGLLVVLPVMWEETADICVETALMPDSASGFDPMDLLIVDNSRGGWAKDRYGLRTHRDPAGHNLGVARSWNIGVGEVLNRGLDYLVLMSASMRFGPVLHTTWRRQMNEFWGTKVVESIIHSWHLIAFHRSVFEKVGRFDPAYYPAYHEATDFGYRMRMVGWEQGWVKVPVNALSMGVALHAPLVACPAGPLLAHYRERWGGDKGEETFVQPYGSKPLDYVVEEPIPVLAERYGLGERGVGWW